MFTKEELKKIITLAMFVTVSIIIYHLLDNFTSTLDFFKMLSSIFAPITTGFVIAYIVNIPMKSVERTLFDKLPNKIKLPKKLTLPKKIKLGKGFQRAISLLVTILIGGVFFTILFSFAIPQLVDSVNKLIEQIPGYATSVGIYLEDQFVRLNVSQDIIDQAETMWANFLDTLAAVMLNVANTSANFVSKFISGIFNAILSTVLAIYILLSKENLKLTFKKVLYAFTNEKFSTPFIKYSKIIDNSFEHFIRGQMLEAVILGIICYIGMLIFGFEYALLISMLVGITNVIPLFGPYIGSVPSFLLLLMVNPVHAFWFILYVAVLQQIESNLIYPRVVGSSMGISGFWIIVAVVVGNSLFGILGILLGIPILSSLYIIVGEIAEKRLEKKQIHLNKD